MKFNQQHLAIGAVILIILIGFVYYYVNSPKTHSGNHKINQTHGTLKVWLSDTCPWCSKQVEVFERENSIYEKQEGSPPEGAGVPQTQSATTGKVCKGFKEVGDLVECLQ